ncbi:unnamed protein product [Parajaminaea phylloscopi]
MMASYKEAYLHLLKQHHATLAQKGSLAAPHYAVAIQSLTVCPIAMTAVDKLEVLEGFSAGVRRTLAQLVAEEGGEAVVMAELSRRRSAVQAGRPLLESIDTIGTDGISQSTPQASIGHRPPSGGSRRATAPARDAEPLQKSAKQDAQKLQKSRKDPPPGSSGTTCKLYHPPLQSGGYAIMIALLLLGRSARAEQAEADSTQEGASFTKDEVIALASKHCRQSFTHQFANRRGGSSGGAQVPKYATAWARMKTLLQKGLIWQRGRPARFTLSPEGNKVARQLARQAHLDVQMSSDDESDADKENADRYLQASTSTQPQGPSGRPLGQATAGQDTATRPANTRDDQSSSEDDNEIEFAPASPSPEPPRPGTATGQRRPRAVCTLILPPKEIFDEPEAPPTTPQTPPQYATRPLRSSSSSSATTSRPSRPRSSIWLPPKELATTTRPKSTGGAAVRAANRPPKYTPRPSDHVIVID